MKKYGEQGREQQINTNTKVFREQPTANIKNKFALWPLRFIHLLKPSPTFFRCFQNCSDKGLTGLFKWEEGEKPEQL